MKKIENLIKKIKGFTLIELLAVIVILAIILLIAMPIVLNVINEARKGAFETSARGLIKAVENDYMKNSLNNNTTSKTYVFENYEQTEGNLEFSGKAPKEGRIIVLNDGRKGIAVTDGNVCIKKGFDDKDFVIEETSESCEFPYNDQCIVDGNTASSIIDERDGKEYQIVQIGEQCWFAENLAYTDNGELECLINIWKDHTQPSPWDACLVNGGTGWDQNEVMYQWGAAMNGLTAEGSQGLCPTGWYIPTDNNWKTLEMYLGMTQAQADATNWRGTNQGQQLKSTDPSWGGTNTVGFNGKPAGGRNTSGSLSSVGSYGHWWSSSPSGTVAWRRSLYSGHSDVHRDTISQALGYSVRCVLGL